MASIMKLLVEMGLNTTAFQAGLKTAGNAAAKAGSGFASNMKGMVAGYFGFQALEAGFKAVVGRMGKIQDQSDQFNITTDDVQKLSAAAEDVGLSFEDVGSAMNKMGTARKAALEGDQDKIDAFNKFGVGGMIGGDAVDVDIFRQMGKNIDSIKMDSETMQMMRELFGRSGSRMVAVLKEMGNARTEPLISAADLKSVDEAEAAFKRLGRAITVALAPGVGGIADGVTNVAEEPKEFVADYLSLLVPWAPKRANKAESTRADNALPRTREKKTAYAGAGGDMADMFLEEQMMFKNPKLAIEAAKAKEALRKKQEDMIFHKAGRQDKIGILEKQQAESKSQLAYTEQQAVSALYTKEIKEARIVELLTEQEDLKRKIFDLNEKDKISAADFRNVLAVGGGGVGGGNPATVGASGSGAKTGAWDPNLLRINTEQMNTLKAIQKSLDSGAAIFSA